MRSTSCLDGSVTNCKIQRQVETEEGELLTEINHEQRVACRSKTENLTTKKAVLGCFSHGSTTTIFKDSPKMKSTIILLVSLCVAYVGALPDITLNSRIIGGRPAKKGEFPYQ